jgi:hypothetical protein
MPRFSAWDRSGNHLSGPSHGGNEPVLEVLIDNDDGYSEVSEPLLISVGEE